VLNRTQPKTDEVHVEDPVQRKPEFPTSLQKQRKRLIL